MMADDGWRTDSLFLRALLGNVGMLAALGTKTDKMAGKLRAANPSNLWPIGPNRVEVNVATGNYGGGATNESKDV